MFNLAKGTDRSFREGQVLGGVGPRDADSYRTLFAGKYIKLIKVGFSLSNYELCVL